MVHPAQRPEAGQSPPLVLAPAGESPDLAWVGDDEEQPGLDQGSWLANLATPVARLGGELAAADIVTLVGEGVGNHKAGQGARCCWEGESNKGGEDLCC